MIETTSVKDWLAIIAMGVLLLAGGAATLITSSGAHLRDWLINHQLLLPPGGGLLTIPHLGALDPGRVVILIALMVLAATTARILTTRRTPHS